MDITDSTAVRFQWLHDAISGASPTGALPGSNQPFLSEVEDVRTGILGATDLADAVAGMLQAALGHVEADAAARAANGCRCCR